MENVESTTLNQDNAQSPLSDTPVIISAECTEGNTIKLTWTLSAPAKRAVTRHRLTYTMVQSDKNVGVKIEEDIDDWEQLSVKDNSIVFIKNLNEKGVYTCRVQPFYGDLYGLASDPSEPVFTKEFLKQTEDAVASLKSLLNSSSDLSAFDTSEKSKYNSELIPNENCEVGWLYNFVKQKPESLNLISGFISKSPPDDTKSKLTIQNDNATIKFTYESYSETLMNNSDRLFLKTISETMSTHYIVSQVKGYEIIVSLRSKEGQQNLQKLGQIVKTLKEGKNLSEEFQEDILFSVSGKIPQDCHETDQILTLDKFSELKRYTSEEFYIKIGSKPFTLSVNLLPLNLVYYFSPFYQKLEYLKENCGTDDSGTPWNQLVDFFCKETLKKIGETAESITQYKNCSKNLIFLKQLLQYNIIDQIQKENMFEKVNAKSTVQTSDGSNVTAKVVVKISLKKITQDLIEQFAVWFSTNSQTGSYNAALSKELLTQIKSAYSIERELTEISQTFQRNHRQFSIVREITLDDKIDVSTCEYIFERQGNVISPKPLVFDSPLKLTATKINNSDSVELSWDMSDESKLLVTGYQVEWRMEDCLNWESNSSKKSNETKSIIQNLEYSNYDFRVCAMYDTEIPGKFAVVSIRDERKDENQFDYLDLENVWKSADNESSNTTIPPPKFIVPCERGDTVVKKCDFKFSVSTCCSCQFIDEKRRRNPHVECDTCKNVFHFPHNEEKNLIKLPINLEEMKELLNVKLDTRRELTRSFNEIRRTFNEVNNELERLQGIMEYSLLAADTKSKRLIIKAAEEVIDGMVLQCKPEILAKIDELQDLYLSHVDNVRDYSLRSAVSLLLKFEIDFSTCDKGIISKAEEISENFSKDLKESDRLYMISYSHSVKVYNGTLFIEFEIIFHKVPKFFEQYVGMSQSTNNLKQKLQLLDETIDEVKKKCVNTVDKLHSVIERDVREENKMRMEWKREVKEELKKAEKKEQARQREVKEELRKAEEKKVEEELRKAEEKKVEEELKKAEEKKVEEEEEAREREKAKEQVRQEQKKIERRRIKLKDLKRAAANWKCNFRCDWCKKHPMNTWNWPYYCHMCDVRSNGGIKECDLNEDCYDHFTRCTEEKPCIIA